MFQQPQTQYNPYGSQSQQQVPQQPQQQHSVNTPPNFYQSGGVPNRPQLFQSPSQSNIARVPDQSKDTVNPSSLQTTYLPGYLIASQAGRGPPASIWATPSVEKTTPTKEDENPFAKEAPIFRDSRDGASTSFNNSTPYTSRTGFTLAKGTPGRSPGERPTPYSPEYTRNTPPEDEDSVPQVSLSDIPPGPRRRPAGPDDSGFSLASDISGVGIAPQVIKLVVFGFPAHMTTRIIKDFTSFGKDQVLSQEMGPEGSNYFVVGYRDPALAARVARRNGELMDGIYRIGVMYQDPRQQPIDGMLPSTTPPPDASLAPASATSPHHLQTRASNVSLANTSALIPNPPKKSTYEWLTGMFVPPPTPAKPLPGQVLPPSLTAPAAAAPTPAAPTAPAAQPWGVTTAVNKVSELVFGW